MLGRRLHDAINWLVSGQGRIAAYAILVMTLMVKLLDTGGGMMIMS